MRVSCCTTSWSKFLATVLCLNDGITLCLDGVSVHFISSYISMYYKVIPVIIRNPIQYIYLTVYINFTTVIH